MEKELIANSLRDYNIMINNILIIIIIIMTSIMIMTYMNVKIHRRHVEKRSDDVPYNSFRSTCYTHKYNAYTWKLKVNWQKFVISLWIIGKPANGLIIIFLCEYHNLSKIKYQSQSTHQVLCNIYNKQTKSRYRWITVRSIIKQ